MHRPAHITIFVALALLLACGCGDDAKLAGDDVVLADVNGSPITKYDVDRAIVDNLGGHAASRLDEDARKKLLQSLVQSRSIAQAREKELKPQELAALEKGVTAYREELLVKQYLAKHAPSKSVSPAAIEKYYRDHPERFGGKQRRSYELVSATAPVAPEQRSKLIEALGRAPAEPDWQPWVEQLKQAGHSVAVRRGLADDPVLHPKLRKLLAQLEVGKPSNVTFVDGQPHVAKITAEQQQPPRPLAEVSGEIRKILAPTQLKEAVEQAAKQAMKGSEVAYR